MKKVLFICTGNYYRSRFAQALFARGAAEAGLRDWEADSAGLRIDAEQRVNIGPMSPVAVERLRRLGVDPQPHLRLPRDLTLDDLQSAAQVIVLEEAEHRPMLAARFPDWTDRVTFWHVRDRDPTPDYDPLAEIQALVDHLLSELGA